MVAVLDVEEDLIFPAETVADFLDSFECNLPFVFVIVCFEHIT